MKTVLRAALSAVLSCVFLVGASARGEEADSRELFREGAQLWPKTCGTCHNARPGSERSPAEWDAVMAHMRTVANLSEHQTQAILAYLKAR